MRALLICPCFFDYEKEIKEGLENAGYFVDFFDEKPFNNVFFKICVRLFGRIFFIRNIVTYYFNGIFKKLNDDYELVIIIKGESLFEELLIKMKSKFKKSRFIFYSWDSLSNYPHVEKYLYLFDKSYTFDDVDAENIEGLNHLPLFFSRQFFDGSEFSCVNNRRPKLVFAGTVHSDRYKILGEISLRHNQLYDFEYFMYFPSVLLLIKFFMLNYNDILKYKLFGFTLKSKNKKQLKAFFLMADCIIDIQHPAQKGLTMRTIEIIPLCKKLITTNSQIINYPFYNKNNYLVVDRNHPLISADFMQSPFDLSEIHNVDEFSIDNWIKNLCS